MGFKKKKKKKKKKERVFLSKRFSRAWVHTARVSRAEAAQKRSVCRAGAARPLCFHSPRQHEREGVRSGWSATRIWFSN